MSALHTLTQSAKAAAVAPQENKLITNLILIPLPLLFSLQWRAITKRGKTNLTKQKGGEGGKKQAQHKTKEAITAKIK